MNRSAIIKKLQLRVGHWDLGPCVEYILEKDELLISQISTNMFASRDLTRSSVLCV